MKLRLIALQIGLLLTVSAICQAQNSSKILGTVTDPSGAVVPSAQVTAKEVGTGFTRSTSTDLNGYYVITSLRPTNYTLTVEAPGFPKLTQTSFTLLADQSLTVNLQLELGKETQTLSVTGTPPQVDTSTATLSEVVDEKRTVELPLNGRNAATLTTLAAGVVVDTGVGNDPDQGSTKTFPSAVTISTNGSRSNQVAYLLDGANNIDNYTNVNMPFPCPDATQEFSAQTANYSAQFGQNAGGVVNVVTKSGTNSLHGDLFEFNRNAVFNARNFFAADRDELKRNQFGGTVGGPIVLPGVYNGKDRTFFFFGYQGTEIRDTFEAGVAFVPTAANLRGDFSALLDANNPDNPVGQAVQLTNPATGEPFPQNQVDPSTYDAVAVAVSTKYLPQVNGTGLTIFPTPLSQNFREFTTRVDHALSAGDQLSFRYFVDRFQNSPVFANNDLLTDTGGSTILAQNYLLHETHTFRPNLLNNLSFAYIREYSRRGPAPGVPNFGDLGVNIYQPPQNVGIHGINVDSFFYVGNFPFAQFVRNDFSWIDDVKWIRGRHNLAFGGNVARGRMDQINMGEQGGDFTFSGYATGNALADFLLGKVRNFSQASVSFFNDRDTFYGFYGEDSYHASRRLTLVAGLRWEPWFPWRNDHRGDVFLPNEYSAGIQSRQFVNAPPGLFFPGDSQYHGNGVNRSLDQFAPRLGFAYDILGNGKMSVRGGVGAFYDTRTNSNSNLGMGGGDPYSIGLSLTDPQGPFSNPLLGVANPFPAPTQPSSDSVFPAPVGAETYDPSGRYKVPVTYSWNLALERQLGLGWLARIAYVGSHASNLVETIDLNPSQYIPGSDLGPDDRRLFLGYTDIYMDGQVGDSNYNGLQVTFEKRFTHNLTILASYTYSKSLDDLPYGAGVTGVPNGSYVSPMPWTMPGWRRNDRGQSEFDHTHNFVVSYVWNLPGLSNQNRFTRGLLGNWEWSGIVSAFTGDPVGVLAGQDQSQTALGADRVLDLSTHHYLAGACQDSAPCVNWLDPNAFGLPPLGTFGNIGKNPLRGPGLFNWDMGVFKNISISERLTLQFRAEFFNTFNRANFQDPNNSLTGGGFGQIYGARDPRIGQLALKLRF